MQLSQNSDMIHAGLSPTVGELLCADAQNADWLGTRSFNWLSLTLSVCCVPIAKMQRLTSALGCKRSNKIGLSTGILDSARNTQQLHEQKSDGIVNPLFSRKNYDSILAAGSAGGETRFTGRSTNQNPYGEEKTAQPTENLRDMLSRFGIHGKTDHGFVFVVHGKPELRSILINEELIGNMNPIRFLCSMSGWGKASSLHIERISGFQHQMNS